MDSNGIDVAVRREEPRTDDCSFMLGDMDVLHRLELFNGLVMERLARKCGEVKELFEQTGCDWAQTLYAMVFRSMGGNRNKSAFLKLADIVKYHICMKERNSLAAVETMLIGASGLLEREAFDDYVLRMRSEFQYLKNKYGFEKTMMAGEWDMWRLSPANAPVLRMAQVAALVVSDGFGLDAMLECRTRDDVQRLFVAEASDHWVRRFGLRDGGRLGTTKVDIIGINVVVPVMFAYGEYTGYEQLKSRAVELLEDIPAENNVIVRRWTGRGVPVKNAFDTQALLQLNNEYCMKNRCGECNLPKKSSKAG